MQQPNTPRPFGSARARRAVVVLSALLLAGIVWGVGNSPWRPGGGRELTSLRDVSSDSPYLNTRPGIAYVGDAVCARCHEDIAKSYSEHPMGRSLAPVEGGEGEPPVGAEVGLPFESQGVHYALEHRDGRTFHRTWREGSNGEVFAAVEAEVQYALGSGTRGISYLIERDGFLQQSPIAWFAQQKRWDISPGYGGANPRPSFERPIQRGCLFCHTNQIHSVAGTLNRYEPPIFEGHAIGCERCHGPGELHASGGAGSAEPDLTIVNPARLAPSLRDSVCQQCHLQGWFRFPRSGHDFFDFRPGLPLHRFIAVFARSERDPDRLELIGQVEQMESSRCFLASGGKLGCISCHDPHRLPPPETKAEYYRARCLKCHEQDGCALPVAERQSRGPGEDCVACHMPRPPVADIPHTLTTDHRIPRVSGTHEASRTRRRPRSGLPGEFVPVDYHRDQMTPEERRAGARDEGLALEFAAQELGGAPPLARLAATQALPLLESAVRERPDDLPARESLGYALGILDRLPEARKAYEAVLRIEPRRESALPYLARTLGALQRPDLAAEALRQSIAVNPWRADYHLALARNCAQARDWLGAIAACRQAIRLNPELHEARSMLVRCYVASGEADQADAEFLILLELQPASRDLWRRWYAQLKQTQRSP